jgi:VWFA-related protein
VLKRLAKFTFQCALVLSFSAAFIGSPRSQTQSAPPSANAQIRVSTNEVIAPVTVTDLSGDFVLDLSQKDFHIFDDGVEQTIDHWDLGGDHLAVVLVLETSTRLHKMIPMIHGLGSILSETAMALSGEAAVITYDSTVELRQPFTRDHQAVADAIATVKFEAPERMLYDAMDSAVQMLKDQSPRWRRIMLVVGESEDVGSTAKLGSVVREAALENITIYAVGPRSAMRDFLDAAPALWAAPAIFLLQEGKNKAKNHDLEVAASATGGIHYGAIRAATLQSAVDRIGGELHAQYIIGYRPNSERAPGFHAITVTVARPNVSIRARPGYYVPPPPTD